MPVCLCISPLRTPDPPHPASNPRNPTQPRLCARRSRNQNLSARISNFFFSLPSNHLRPKTPDFQQTCARAPRHTGVYMEGHTNASDRLRPRPDQTHPSRQRRHADSLVQPRPALLPGPLVVPSTSHRRSTRRSPRESSRTTSAPARSETRAINRDFRVRAASLATGSLRPTSRCIFKRSCCARYQQLPAAKCWPASCCHQSTHQ